MPITNSVSNALSHRDQAEIIRSASEAKSTPLRTAEINRYIKPSTNTIYGLEYAFHLLGDVKGKTVVDLGCGSGENLPALLKRGANVFGIDLSNELITLAQRRIWCERRLGDDDHARLVLQCRTAYGIGLKSESVDAIFCMALIHHLELPKVQQEMLRILKPGGVVILKEPIRFSPMYAKLRKLFPQQKDVSEFEHPLTREELEMFTKPFRIEMARYFRLPFIPLIEKCWRSQEFRAYRASDAILKKYPVCLKYATEYCARLVKK